MGKAYNFYSFRKELKSVVLKLSGIFYFFLLLSIPLFAQSPKELFELSQTAQENGDFVLAEKYLLAVLQQKEDIKANNLVAVYNGLGIINEVIGKYDKAIEYYSRGENIVLKNIGHLQYKLPSIYNNIGNVYSSMGDYKKALGYFHESIKNQYLAELPEGDRKGLLSYAYNNMGIIYFSQKNYSEAIIYFKKRSFELFTLLIYSQYLQFDDECGISSESR